MHVLYTLIIRINFILTIDNDKNYYSRTNISKWQLSKVISFLTTFDIWETSSNLTLKYTVIERHVFCITAVYSRTINCFSFNPKVVNNLAIFIPQIFPPPINEWKWRITTHRYTNEVIETSQKKSLYRNIVIRSHTCFGGKYYSK